MADHRGPYDKNYDYREENMKQANNLAGLATEASTESHMIYELNQQREYHIRKLMDIQKAIDAIRMIR